MGGQDQVPTTMHHCARSKEIRKYQPYRINLCGRSFFPLPPPSPTPWEEKGPMTRCMETKTLTELHHKCSPALLLTLYAFSHPPAKRIKFPSIYPVVNMKYLNSER